GKNSLNRLIRCVCGKKIGPDPRNFNQRVSLGRNDLLIRTFPNTVPQSANYLDPKLYEELVRAANNLAEAVFRKTDWKSIFKK
ncbi:hypothetical protein, partial [Klebsiella pneumoniae]|uniref:hypothetical protein n=1 Tax=Klebsiella pneumoniae TaxID=573 RepID=UPI0019555FCD